MKKSQQNTSAGKLNKKWKRMITAGISLCAVSAGLAPVSGSAQTDQTWTGGTNGNWSVDGADTNWAAPVAADPDVAFTDGNNAIFDAAGAGTITIIDPLMVNNITVNEDGFTFTGAAFAGFTGDLTIADEKTLNIGSDVFAGMAVNQKGKGTLDLDAISTATSFTLEAGSNIMLDGFYNQEIDADGNVTRDAIIAGNGNVDLGGSNTTLGSLSAANVEASGVTLTVNGATTVANVTLVDGLANFNGATNLTNLDLGFSGDANFNGASTVTGVISGGLFSSLSINANTTLSGENTFTGDLNVGNEANLTITHAHALGSRRTVIPAEDLNDDGNIDPGEDVNGNGVLDPEMIEFDPAGVTRVAGFDNNATPDDATDDRAAGSLTITGDLTVDERIIIGDQATLNVDGKVTLLNTLTGLGGNTGNIVLGDNTLTQQGDMTGSFDISANPDAAIDLFMPTNDAVTANLNLINVNVLFDATALPTSTDRNTANPVIADGDTTNRDNFTLTGSSTLTLTGSASANFTEDPALAGARTHSAALFNDGNADFLDRDGDGVSDQAVEDFATLTGTLTIAGTNTGSDIISTAGENRIQGNVLLQENGQIEAQSGFLTITGNIDGALEEPVDPVTGNRPADITESLSLVAGANAQLTVQGNIGGATDPNAAGDPVSRTANVTVSGAGRTEFEGNNNYAGVTTVQAGTTLAANSDNALGAEGTATSGHTTVAAGATLSIGERNGTMLDAAGNPMSVYNGVALRENTIILNGTGRGDLGALHRGGGAAGGASVNNIQLAANSTICVIDDQIVADNGATEGVPQMTSLAVNGTLNGNGALSKLGTGNLILTSDSSATYTGAITVDAGVLTILDGGALGSADINTTVQNGATLWIVNPGAGAELEVAEQEIVLNGPGARTEVNDAAVAGSAEGALHLVAAAGAQTRTTVNNLTAATNSTIFVESNGQAYATTTVGLNRLVVNGQLSGAGNVEVIGGGAVELTQDSPLTGDLNVRNGQVIIRTAGGLGSGVVTAESLGIVSFAMNNDRNTTINTDITLNGGALHNQGGHNTHTGTITLGNSTAGDADLNGNVILVDHIPFYDQSGANPTESYSLTVTNIQGTTGFTKTGQDLLIIEGDQNYGGVTNITADPTLGTVNGGVVEIRSAGALGLDDTNTDGIDNLSDNVTLRGTGLQSNTAANFTYVGPNSSLEIHAPTAAGLTLNETFLLGGNGATAIINPTTGNVIRAASPGALRSVHGNNTINSNLWLDTSSTVTAVNDSLTLNGQIQGTGGQEVLTLLGDGDITVNGAIGMDYDLGGINVNTAVIGQGTGTVTFTGENVYSGVTTVGAGTLVVTNASGLGQNGVNNNTVVAANAAVVLENTGAADATINEDFILAGEGVSSRGALISRGTNTITGLINLNGGGNVKVASEAVDGTSSLTLNGEIAGDGFTGLELSGAPGGMITLNGQIRQSVSGLIINGDGTYLITGDNEYTGLTTVQNGTLQVSHARALGGFDGTVTTDGTTVNGATATLELHGGISLTEGIQINDQGTVINAVGDNTLLRQLNVSGSQFANLGAATDTTLTLSAGIGGSGTLRINTKENHDGTIKIEDSIAGVNTLVIGHRGSTGTVELSARNNHSSTIIDGGNVVVGASGALGSNNDAGNGNIATATIQSDSTILTKQGLADLDLSNDFQIDSSLTIDNAANLELSGNISGGVSKSITVKGAGSLALNDTSSFTGGLSVENTVNADGSISNAGAVELQGRVGISNLNIETGNTVRVLNRNSFRTAQGNVATNLVATVNGTLDVTDDETVHELHGSGQVVVDGDTLTVHEGNFAGNITGDGGFTKARTGDLALTGASDYTGATNIAGGHLVLSGDGALTGTTSVNIGTGAVLTLAAGNDNRINDAAAVSLTGGQFIVNNTETVGSLNLGVQSIGGTGSITAGNVTLSGNGTTVAVNITGESLDVTNNAEVSDGGLLSVETVTVDTGATLTLNGTDEVADDDTMNGSIANTTNVSVAGELNLAKDETVAVLTTQNGASVTGFGNVKASAVNATSSTFNVGVTAGSVDSQSSTFASGLTSYIRTDEATGDILTTGNVNLAGGEVTGDLATAGLLSLDGVTITGNVTVGSMDVDSGLYTGTATLTGSTIGGTFKAGTLNNSGVTYNGAVTVNTATVDSATFNSSVTANALTVSGSSVAQGVVTVANTLTVSGGTFTTNADVTADTLQVNSGATWAFNGSNTYNTLAGSGTVRGNVVNTTTINPNGTLTIDGNYTERGTLAVDLSTNDVLAVTGDVNLDKNVALLAVTDPTSALAPTGARANVINASGDITGGFARISNTGAAQLLFDTGTGDVASLGNLNPASFNKNERVLYNALATAALDGVNFDSTDGFGQHFNNIVLNGGDNTGQLLAGLSPESYAGAADYAAHATRNYARNIKNTAALTTLGGGGGFTGGKGGSFGLPSSTSIEVLAGYSNLNVSSDFSGTRNSYELEGHGGYFGLRANDNNGRYSVGSFLAFDDSDVTGNNVSLEGDGVVWGAFANYKPMDDKPLNLWAEISYGAFDFEGNRGAYRSDVSSSSFQIGGGGSYTVYQENGFSVAPAWGLRYMNSTVDKFQEKGDALALSVDSIEDDALVLDLGVDFKYKQEGNPFGVNAYLGYQNDFYDNDRRVTANFKGQPDFAVGAAGIDSDAFIYSFGAHYDLTKSTRVSLSYYGENRDDAEDYSSVNLNLSVGF